MPINRLSRVVASVPCSPRLSQPSSVALSALLVLLSAAEGIPQCSHAALAAACQRWIPLGFFEGLSLHDIKAGKVI